MAKIHLWMKSEPCQLPIQPDNLSITRNTRKCNEFQHSHKKIKWTVNLLGAKGTGGCAQGQTDVALNLSPGQGCRHCEVGGLAQAKWCQRGGGGRKGRGA